jgi:hypothetical protein
MTPELITSLITAGVAIAGIVVWAFATFHTKEDAKNLWRKLEVMNETVGRTAEGVAYIKGKLEPKGE